MHVDHHCYADHPTDPDIVYFGNDGGVYRTTDGGQSFRSYNTGYVTSQFYNGFSCSHQTGGLAMGGLQDNSSKVYQGTKNWKRVLGGDGAFTAINTENDNYMYGSSQNLAISRSTNGGDSWSKATTGIGSGSSCFIAPFVLAPSEPSILYAGKTQIYKTTNNASSWTAMNNGNSLNGNPIIAIGVSPSNADVVYAATVPRSNDRGEISCHLGWNR